MAKSVIINGVSYNAVPYVSIPLQEYNSSATYNIGDVCAHTSKSYKCKVDNTTGAWDSSKWDEISGSDGKAKFVDTDVSSNAAAAADMKSGKTAYVNGEAVTGTMPNAAIAQSSSMASEDGRLIHVSEMSEQPITPWETNYIDYYLRVTPSYTATTGGYIPSDGAHEGNVMTRYLWTSALDVDLLDLMSIEQEIYPSQGYLFGKVTLPALNMTGNATAADVLSGKTFYSTSLTKLTGTATVPTVSQDQTYHYLTIQ